jgi:hypothetical protein
MTEQEIMLKGLTDFLDEFFNGLGCAPEDRHTGFALIYFPLAPGGPGLTGHLSNVDSIEVEYKITKPQEDA